jgi:hypothetical protein
MFFYYTFLEKKIVVTGLHDNIKLPVGKNLYPSIIKVRSDNLLSTTNKMKRYTVFFIVVNALHVSGGFSAHHQELKNCTHSRLYVSGLLAATDSGSSRQVPRYQMLCVQFLSS